MAVVVRHSDERYRPLAANLALDQRSYGSLRIFGGVFLRGKSLFAPGPMRPQPGDVFDSAAAYGNCDRATNAFYRSLREIFALQADDNIFLNRALANWPRGAK